MKTSFMRLLVATLLFAIIIGVIVSSIGWLAGWKITVQFSNGLFWAGGILMVLGALSVMGGYDLRSDFNVLYSESAGNMSLSERTQQWVSDITQGYNSFIILILTGGFLIGIGILISNIF